MTRSKEDVVHEFRRLGHFKINAERSYMGREALEAGSADLEITTLLIDRLDQSDGRGPPFCCNLGTGEQLYASATGRGVPDARAT